MYIYIHICVSKYMYGTPKTHLFLMFIGICGVCSLHGQEETKAKSIQKKLICCFSLFKFQIIPVLYSKNTTILDLFGMFRL